jgi:predicted TIM-barrel fold metal-dependent hydrolase
MAFERYKADIERLEKVGAALALAMHFDVNPEEKKKLKEDIIKKLPAFRSTYQSWYSEALTIVSVLLPARRNDFESYYRPTNNRKELSVGNYTISDYLRGLSATRGFGNVVVDPSAAVEPFNQQCAIVNSLKGRLESSLFDIRALVQADFFDDELDAATELNKKGFHRAAGAVAGVVLEGHLKAVCETRKITALKNATISKLNDLLKGSDIIDQATWRFIQHLGDLRNLCDHKKGTDPTSDQMQELIAATRKIMKKVP